MAPTHSADENKLIVERKEKLAQIRQQKKVAFPNDWQRTERSDQLHGEHDDKTKEELEAANIPVSIAGRIMAKRGPFLVIQDGWGQIQAYTDKSAQADIKDQWGQWDIGDIVGVSGPLHKSGRGDLYVYADCYNLLTKSLRPLPEKHAGLVDTETKYRQRYVDLIVTPETRARFVTRSKVIRFIRTFLDQRDFIEVETPMLQTIPGGATARPFETHHNALDQSMFLRIAPELYLKRLLVGGYERVYEINRNFRNEGLSTRHNPEFTMLEFYECYADYHHLMDMTEQLLKALALEIYGDSQVPYFVDKDQDDERIAYYDFGAPFARLTVAEAILRYNPELTEADLKDAPRLRQRCEALGLPTKDEWGLGKLQIEIFEKTAESQLHDPTFITAYPAEVSPLARRNDDDEFVTDRFEFFVGGREIANGFSELNDAEDQAQRFQDQVAQKESGDDEAMHYDADYVRALEHGMPPAAGEGIGIDRLVMLLTNAVSIRDVILFPAMRPESF